MDVAPRKSGAYVEWLVARHPPLALILEEHVSENDGLLPHVFFGDVTRYAADLARRAPAEPEKDDLSGLLEDLDASMLAPGEDDEVDNLIWVSFVENAQGVAGDSEGAALRDHLRSYPNLARALSHYE